MDGMKINNEDNNSKSEYKYQIQMQTQAFNSNLEKQTQLLNAKSSLKAILKAASTFKSKLGFNIKC